MKTSLFTILDPFEFRVYIEFLRLDMLNKGEELGINNKLTIQASQELDYFIYEYQKFLLKYEKAIAG